MNGHQGERKTFSLFLFLFRFLAVPGLFFPDWPLLSSGANGSLTDCGGGLEVKRFLPDLELGQKTSAEKKETFAGKKP